MRTWQEFLEWRGQRGVAGQTRGVDTRKSGGRPKGTWVGGNMRYAGGPETGSMKPHVGRTTDKRDADQEIKQGLQDREED